MPIAVLFFSFFISLSALADWTGTRCSNSDGSVVWESGYNENLIKLKYSNFVEGTLVLETDKVNIHFLREVTLRKKVLRRYENLTEGRVFAGEVKITAAEKTPDVLRGQFPLNRIKTSVICTTVINKGLDSGN